MVKVLPSSSVTRDKEEEAGTLIRTEEEREAVPVAIAVSPRRCITRFALVKVLPSSSVTRDKEEEAGTLIRTEEEREAVPVAIAIVSEVRLPGTVAPFTCSSTRMVLPSEGFVPTME